MMRVVIVKFVEGRLQCAEKLSNTINRISQQRPLRLRRTRDDRDDGELLHDEPVREHSAADHDVGAGCPDQEARTGRNLANGACLYGRCVRRASGHVFTPDTYLVRAIKCYIATLRLGKGVTAARANLILEFVNS